MTKTAVVEGSARLAYWHLLCPTDRAPLEARSGALACPACRRQYPVADGVARFLDKRDDFYEGAYNNQVHFVPRGKGFLNELPLWLVINGYLWRVRRFVRPGAKVVELGCAGGVAWFGRAYKVAGIDVSQEGLRLAAGKYDVCLQASTLAPIPDGSVDAVISSYFWEHIPPADKPGILDEITRVLKPGGHIVFVYDVTTSNPLIAWLRRRRPDLYQALFIDSDGHLGYQTPAENDALIEKAGFRLLVSNPMERSLLQAPSIYLKMRSWPGIPAMIGAALSFLNSSPFLFPYTAMLRLIDETVGRLLPPRWGRIMITVATKQ